MNCSKTAYKIVKSTRARGDDVVFLLKVPRVSLVCQSYSNHRCEILLRKSIRDMRPSLVYKDTTLLAVTSVSLDWKIPNASHYIVFVSKTKHIPVTGHSLEVGRTHLHGVWCEPTAESRAKEAHRRREMTGIPVAASNCSYARQSLHRNFDARYININVVCWGRLIVLTQRSSFNVLFGDDLFVSLRSPGSAGNVKSRMLYSASAAHYALH